MRTGEDTPLRIRARRARGLASRLACLLGLLALLASAPACRRAPPPTPRTPTPLPTAPPIPIIATPTVSFPPKMGLVGTIDPAVAKALTASVPAIPTHVGESRSERAETSAPATPPPTSSIR